MPFEPIAITGQSALLPGALSAEALWDEVVAPGRVVIGPAPAGRWRITPDRVLGGDTPSAVSNMVGAVIGFDEQFDPHGFEIPPDEIQGLDRHFRMVLHGAREATRDAGLSEELRPRAGLILANLSYPTDALSRWGEWAWLERARPGAAAVAGLDRPDPRSRFMSGLPAILAARALGLGGAAFSLDAACASALYAIKLGCDALHDGRLDAVVVGAVNGTDDLFLHVGFTALQALSRTGQSRPFHRGANGLVPAEGAGFVVLRRLADVGEERVLGVIRGVGLSNDGRAGGLLNPSWEGQARAIRAAWDGAGLDPASATYIECHATGTPVGDRTEVQSLQAVFGDRALPMGSLKANLGHGITAAGMAGLIKVLGGLRRGLLPPMPRVEDPIEGLGGLRLVTEVEPWEGVRRAGIDAFGFGGNNAHVILEAGWPPPSVASRHLPPPSGGRSVEGIGPHSELEPGPIATSHLPPPPAKRGGELANASEAGRRVPRRGGGGPAFLPAPDIAILATAVSSGRPLPHLDLDLQDLRFPPNDLKLSLGQQLALFQTARDALAGLDLPPRDRIGVIIGMGTDASITRHGLRWRSADLGHPDAADSAQDPLTAAAVVGAMPNILANRLNHQLDAAGPGFVVSAEESSGLIALQLAARMLRRGELDLAIVGAVDLATEPVHAAAAEALGLPPPADAAVVFMLQRNMGGAQALLDLDGPAGLTVRVPEDLDGHAHAASGLLGLARAVDAVSCGVRPGRTEPQPWWDAEGPRVARVVVSGLGAGEAQVRGVGPTRPYRPERARRVLRYAGETRADLLAAARADRRGGDGPVRLALVGDAPEARRDRALDLLATGQLPWEPGIYASEGPVSGELAFLFTGAAGPTPGMGASLYTAFPEIGAALGARLADLPQAYWPDTAPVREAPAEQMVASSLLAQAHAVFTRQILGIQPTAAMGYSLGESNMLHALGAWDALTPMMRDILSWPLFTTELAGDFAAVRRVWGETGPGPVWENWTVAASAEATRAALEDRVYLLLINAPGEVVLGGWPPACARVLARLGAAAARLDYPLAVHAPVVRAVEADWLAYHRRAVSPVPGVRFYSAAWGRAYEAEAERCAQALLGHAVDTLDFPALVEAAWADGVRLWVEHGPRDLCAGWIRRILKGRPHRVISLDRAERPALHSAAEAVAQLWVSGVPMRAAGVAAFDVAVEKVGRRLRIPAHRAAVVLGEPGVEILARAPGLPRVLGPTPLFTPVSMDEYAGENAGSTTETRRHRDPTRPEVGADPPSPPRLIDSLGNAKAPDPPLERGVGVAHGHDP